MKRGLRRPGNSAGFTIVETMIVLAVTGVLFVAVATTWSGKQHKNEFTSSSQEIRSKIQQTISEVQAGFFPSNGDIGCQATPGKIVLSAAASAQGQNQDCVFLGKVIQFKMSASDPEQFKIFSVAGRRDTKGATDLASAYPTVLAPANGVGVVASIPDHSEIGKLMYGLTTVSMKSGGEPVGAVGFISRIGSIDGATGGLKNGSQQIDLYAIKTSLSNNYGSTPIVAAEDLNSDLRNPSKYILNKPVQICFKSGGTNKYALVTIGSSSSELTSTLTVMNSPAAGETPCGI